MSRHKSCILLAVSLSLSSLKSIAISRNGMRGRLKCSLKAMMPASRAELQKDPLFEPQYIHMKTVIHKGKKSCIWSSIKAALSPEHHRQRQNVHFLSLSLHTAPPSYNWQAPTSCSCCLATPLHWRTKSASLFFCHSQQLSQGPCL